jgi:hypothetical protein
LCYPADRNDRFKFALCPDCHATKDDVCVVCGGLAPPAKYHNDKTLHRNWRDKPVCWACTLANKAPVHSGLLPSLFEFDDSLCYEPGQDEELLDRLETAVEGLEDRQRIIIEHRFIHNRTLESVGAMIGITRERVRQVQRQALQKLAYELSESRGQQFNEFAQNQSLKQFIKRRSRKFFWPIAEWSYDI